MARSRMKKFGIWSARVLLSLVIGGTLKGAYDLLLLRMFRAVRPPEEATQQQPAPAPRPDGGPPRDHHARHHQHADGEADQSHLGAGDVPGGDPRHHRHQPEQERRDDQGSRRLTRVRVRAGMVGGGQDQALYRIRCQLSARSPGVRI